MMLDAAYDAYENYRVIRYSGRRPVIDPRKDHTLKGYNPRAEMLRWRKENPEEFERDVPPAQLGGVRVLVVQGQVWRRSCGKDAPATEAPADPEKHLLQPAVVVKLHAPDACPSPSARCAALPRSAPIPVPLQSECVKERPNRRNRGLHGTVRTASSRMAFAEMDNAYILHLDCEHIRKIHLRSQKRNNNIEKRLNGDIRDREKAFSGLKKADFPIIANTVLYHNYFWLHRVLVAASLQRRLESKSPGTASG